MSKDSWQECTSLYHDYVTPLFKAEWSFLGGLLYLIHVRNWTERWIYILSFWCVRDTEENEMLASLRWISIWKLIHLMVVFFVCLFVSCFQGNETTALCIFKYQEMYLALLPFSFYSTHIDLTIIQTRSSSRAETVSMSPLLLSTMGYWCTVKVHQ